MSPLRALIPGLASGFAVMFAAFAEAAKPAPVLTVSEWAHRHRHIGADSQARFPGKWSNTLTPYLVEPMDACQVGNGIRRVTLTGSAQFGKTECPVNAMGQNICSDKPVSWIVLLPSIDQVGKYGELKLDANIKASPEWALRVSSRKERSGEGSTSKKKKFQGGNIWLLTAGSSKDLQIITAGAAIFEELAQYDAAVGVGGDPISAVEARMTTYGLAAKTLLCSTPGFEGACRITAEYHLSDMRKWHTPCPHCADFHVLDFGALQEHEGRPVFVCPGCGALIEEGDRLGMTERGLWLATFAHPEPSADDELADPEAAAAARAKCEANPPPPKVVPAADVERWRARDCEGRHRGYWFWKAQAHPDLSSWVIILEDWRKVQRGEGGEPFAIEFSQKTLGIPFRKIVERPQHDRIFNARGIIYPTEKLGVPDWASLVTGAIDVQFNRLEWAVYAWGQGGAGARIRSGVIPNHPMAWATWAEHARRLVEMEFRGASFRPRLADYWCVDTGGGVATDNVNNFVMPLQWRTQPVLAIKGASRDKGDHPAIKKGSMIEVRRNRAVIGKVQLWMIGTHGLKSRVYHGLNAGVIAAETNLLEPRSLHFPREATAEDFRQLTAEHLQKKDPTDPGVWEKPQGQPNEQLDLAVYNLAMAVNAMMDGMSARQWADLAAARAPDKVKAELTPLEVMALPDDDPVRIAAEVGAKPLAAPPAEGRDKPKPTDAEMAELAKLWGA